MPFAIIDCDNCFCSCERVFRPDLQGKPLVVLSNNDGCVVSRSNEAKRMGVKMGIPYYQLAHQFPGDQIQVFSSNYELYAELTGRVMSIIRQASPDYFFRYSVDEAFAFLPEGWGREELKAWGENLHRKVAQWVGMPVSIGIAPTKTLAKVAAYYSKHYPAYHHCCLMLTEEQRRKALAPLPVGEVWGVGRRTLAKLEKMGVSSALDFANWSDQAVNASFNVVTYRTYQELNGKNVVPNEGACDKKNITVSRSFSGTITDFEELASHVVNFAQQASVKLRQQGSVASILGVFVATNRFRDDLAQYSNFGQRSFLSPTASSVTIASTARQCLREIFRPGFAYKRAGVMLMGIERGDVLQPLLFDETPERITRLASLDKVVDLINKTQGRDTVRLASQATVAHSAGYNAGYNAKEGENAEVKNERNPQPRMNGLISIQEDHSPRRQFLSANPTTRWSDIMVVK